MQLFGNTIKFLISQRGLTSKEFAERINLSPTSLSKIVNGLTKPRQANLTRIIEELCETPEEEQQLLSAYAQIEEALAEETGQVSEDRFQKMEEDRVRRYLQAKSRSIAFREEVEATLVKAGLHFQGPHQNEDIVCDFFLPGPPRIAMECKANSKRDWDRTITSIRFFLKHLPCHRVIVTLDNDGTISDRDLKRVKEAGGEIAHLNNLLEVILK